VNSDANGDYEFNIPGLPANQSGTVTIFINNMPGYQNYSQNVGITVGNSYTVNIALQPNV